MLILAFVMGACIANADIKSLQTESHEEKAGAAIVVSRSTNALKRSAEAKEKDSFFTVYITPQSHR